MIEILITLLITAFGLLGLAGALNSSGMLQAATGAAGG